MDPVTSPPPAATSPQRGLRGPVWMAALIVTMVVVSIAGSAMWRPAPVERVTLHLGGPTPVGLDARSADETISRVLDLVTPTVAFLTVFDDGRAGGARSGSGVVVHEAGFVVTNAHVVEGAESLLVTFDDGTEYEAVVYGIDVATDLAVVKLDAEAPLQVAALGNSDSLQVGEFVLALGAPFGLATSATSGIISGLHRTGLGIARYEDFIVTDAPINRGNSGGPLVNLRAEVVGINTAIIAGGEDTPGMGGFSGVGFAIPVNVMRVVAQRLIGDGGLTPAGELTERAIDGEAGTASMLHGAAPRRVVRTGAPAVPPTRRPGGVPAASSSDGRASSDRVGGLVARESTQTGMHEAVALIKTFDSRGNAAARGTGFVIAAGSGNLLLTNAHVVRDVEHFGVFFRDQPFAAEAKVVAIDDGLDLALVSFSNADLRPSLPIVGAEGVTVGLPVAAVAARLSEPEEVAVGVVSTGGAITAKGMHIARLAVRATLMQTDAPVRLGDSGGPLLDANGSVVGVMVARGSGDEPGDARQPSYAIELYPGGNLAWMQGLAADPGFDEDTELAYRAGERYITVVTPDRESVLGAAGVEPFDQIIEINGASLEVSEQARREAWLAMKRLPAGTDVELVVSRRIDGSDERENTTIRFKVPER